jgi:hypothetical protein
VDTNNPSKYIAGLIPFVGTAVWWGSISPYQKAGSLLFDVAAGGGFLAAGTKAVSAGVRSGLTLGSAVKTVAKEAISNPLAMLIHPDKVFSSYYQATARDWARGWGVAPDWMPDWVAGTTVQVPETVLVTPVAGKSRSVAKVFSSAPSKTSELQGALRGVMGESLKSGSMFLSVKDYYKGLVESFTSRGPKAASNVGREGRYVTYTSPSGRIDLATTGLQDVLGGNTLMHASRHGLYFSDSRGLRIGDKGLLYEKDLKAVKDSGTTLAPKTEISSSIFDRTLESAKSFPEGVVLEDTLGNMWVVEKAQGYAPGDPLGKELVNYKPDGSLGPVYDMFSNEAIQVLATSRVSSFLSPLDKIVKADVPADLRQGFTTGEKGVQSGLFYGSSELQVGFEDVLREIPLLDQHGKIVLNAQGQPVLLLDEKGQPVLLPYAKDQRGGVLIRDIDLKSIPKDVDDYMRSSSSPQEAAKRLTEKLNSGALEPGFYAVPRTLGPGRVEFEVVSYGVKVIPDVKGREITFVTSNGDVHHYPIMGVGKNPQKLSLMQAVRLKALGEINWIRDIKPVRDPQSGFGIPKPEEIAALDNYYSLESTPGILNGDKIGPDGLIDSTATLGVEPNVGGSVRRDIAVVAYNPRTKEFLFVQDKMEQDAGVHGAITGGVDPTWSTMQLNALASAFSEGGFTPTSITILPPIGSKANPHAVKGCYVAIVTGDFSNLKTLFGKNEITSYIKWDGHTPFESYAFTKDLMTGLKEAGVFPDIHPDAIKIFDGDWKGQVIADKANRDLDYGTRLKGVDAYKIETEIRMPTWASMRPEYMSLLDRPEYYLDKGVTTEIKNVGKASMAQTYTADFTQEAMASRFKNDPLFQVSKVVWTPREKPGLVLRPGESFDSAFSKTETWQGYSLGKSGTGKSGFGFTWGMPGIGFGGLSTGPDLGSTLRGMGSRISSMVDTIKGGFGKLSTSIPKDTSRTSTSFKSEALVSTPSLGMAPELKTTAEALKFTEGTPLLDYKELGLNEYGIRQQIAERVVPASAVGQLEYGKSLLQYSGYPSVTGYGPKYPGGSPVYPSTNIPTGSLVYPSKGSYPSYPGTPPTSSYPGLPPSYPGGPPTYPGAPPPGGPNPPVDTPRPPVRPNIPSFPPSYDYPPKYSKRKGGGGGRKPPAEEVKKVILETKPVPWNVGETTPPGGTPWELNQVAKIEAIPLKEGWKFNHWEGDIPLVDSNKNPATVLMFKDRKCRAVFTKGPTMKMVNMGPNDIQVFLPKVTYKENVLTERQVFSLGGKERPLTRRNPAAYGEPYFRDTELKTSRYVMNTPVNKTLRPEVTRV